MREPKSTIRSRELGDALRLAMERASLNGRRTAKLLYWSESRVSRLLTGQVGASEVEVSAFLAVCGVVGRERDRLLRLTREQATPGWLQQHGFRMPEQLRTLIDHENHSIEINEFETVVIPGLLQTGDYARSLLERSATVGPDEVQERVAARLARQSVFSRERPPNFTFFLHEFILRLPVGAPEIMSEQLHKLLRMSVRSYITVRVIPVAYGAYAAPTGSCRLMEYSEFKPIAYVEQQTAGARLRHRRVARVRDPPLTGGGPRRRGAFSDDIGVTTGRGGKRAPGARVRQLVAGGAPRSAFRRVALLAHTPRRGRGFWYGLAIDLLWPVIMPLSRPVWRGGENVPAAGGVLLASNHVSTLDPITETAFVLAHGRIPRYLARANLWDIPVVGRVLAGGKHIPVFRGTTDALTAYRAGVAALDNGEAVMVYPESTFTRDPDGWPMRGKTGVARMALATGVPVVPIAHWGSQRILRPGSPLPRLLPRKRVDTLVGPPVDLSDLASAEPTREVLDAATKRIMAAITDLLADIRGERPPAA